MIFINNVGTADRLVRIAIGIALCAYALLVHSAALASPSTIIMLVVAAVLIFTAFVSFCPLYRTIGVGTRKKSSVSN